MTCSDIAVRNRFPRSRSTLGRLWKGYVVKRIVLAAAALAALSGPSYAGTISPRRLLEVMDLTNPLVAPDGHQVAFRVERASIERNIYDTVWYVQDLDSKSPPRQIAEGGILLRDSAGGALPAKVVWSPDQNWIYYLASVDAQIGVWRAAVDGSGAEPVTHDPADVRDFTLSADGKTLNYSVGATREAVIAAEQAEYDQGIHIDYTVPVGQGSLVHAGNLEGHLATQRFPRDAMGWERVPLLADAPDRWKAVDLTAWVTRDITSSNLPSASLMISDLSKQLPKPSRIARDPDSGRIAMLTSIGDDEGTLEKTDVQLAILPDKNSSQPIVCRVDLCTGKAISNVQWRPNSDDVLFTVSDPLKGDAQSILRWNVRSGAVHLVTHSDGFLNGGRAKSSACGVSSLAMVCVAAKADRPPRLERVDLATGHRQILFDPNAALAQDIAITTPSRFLRWKDAKGQEFTGQFFPAKRTGNSPPPLFITYYICSGFLRGGLGDEWPLASLAESGISSLCITRAPFQLDAADRYGTGMSAVKSVVGLLASQGEIDRTKVGMGGLSFGSEVTFWTEMNSDILSAASVTSPGIMSSNYYLFGSMRGDVFSKQLKRFWQIGTPDETPDRWRQLAPASNLDKFHAPILMQMPEQEYILALNYAIPLIRENRADLYVFPNESHQKFQPKHKLAAYQRNLDWFRFWLQDYEDSNPKKAEQYKRWQEMRESRGTTWGKLDESENSFVGTH